LEKGFSERVIDMVEIGISLILLGIVLIFISILLSLLMSLGKERKVRGGGIVIIGPLPILLASDREIARLAFLLTLLSIILFLFLIVLFSS